MGVLLTLTAGLVLWIVLWALGVKGFDGFMVTVAMVIGAVALRIFSPFAPGGGAREDS